MFLWARSQVRLLLVLPAADGAIDLVNSQLLSALRVHQLALFRSRHFVPCRKRVSSTHDWAVVCPFDGVSTQRVTVDWRY